MVLLGTFGSYSHASPPKGSGNVRPATATGSLAAPDSILLWIAAGTSHKQNHAIKETCSGARRNLYHGLARDHKRAGGDAAPNALRFANHRRRFPCNSGLLYRRETLDDFTVTRNDLPDFYGYSAPGLHAERWAWAV